jgi:hypothetical protein
MAFKNFYYAPEGVVSSITVVVESGDEVDPGVAVNLAGFVSANARGVIVNSRDKAITLAMLGVVPVRVQDGVTIAVGQAVSANPNGYAIPADLAMDTLGYAIDGVTASSSDYIRIFLNPQPYIAPGV